MVEDRFHNIGTAITNSERKIEVNLIEKQKSVKFNKVRNLQAPLSLNTSLK